MDTEAWSAAVNGVAKSWTWLSDWIELNISGVALSVPLWWLCQKLFLSLLYFNKTLLHQSFERSSLISGPGLNSTPLEAKNPGIFCGSATTFQYHFQFIIALIIYHFMIVFKHTTYILWLLFFPHVSNQRDQIHLLFHQCIVMIYHVIIFHKFTEKTNIYIYINIILPFVNSHITYLSLSIII